jgi:hypothetical protein
MGVAGSLFALAPSVARADAAKHFLSPGLYGGFLGHVDENIQGVLGAELDYTYYPDDTYALGIGAFTQVHTVGFDHIRIAFGPQVNYTLGGLEAGLFIEEGSPDRSTTLGAHISPFVSVGFISLGLRIGVPLHAVDGDRTYAVDVGLSATLKWPAPLDGDYIGNWFR